MTFKEDEDDDGLYEELPMEVSEKSIVFENKSLLGNELLLSESIFYADYLKSKLTF